MDELTWVYLQLGFYCTTTLQARGLLSSRCLRNPLHTCLICDDLRARDRLLVSPSAADFPRRLTQRTFPGIEQRFRPVSLYRLENLQRKYRLSQASSDKLGGKQEVCVESKRDLRSATNVTVSTAGNWHFIWTLIN